MAQPSQPPRPPKRPGQPDRRAVLQAYQDVVREQHERPAHTDPPKTRSPFWIAMGLTAALLATLLILQPVWLFPRPPAESPALKEASLRVRIYVEIDRVDRFKGANGRLPNTLIEAGGDSIGLEYHPRGEHYSITGTNDGVSLTYSSGSSARAFLGNSYQLIR